MTEREMFYRYLGLPSVNPIALEIINAGGIYLHDRSGKKYIDLVSGITVSNIGHRHPKVIDAIIQQVNEHLHLNVYGEFIQSSQVRLAERLTRTLPPSLNSVYFVNSGSEAVEGALKLSKRFTGRTEIISFNNAYHGSTHGALSVAGNETLKRAYRPLLPGIHHIDFNDFCQLERITEQTACVIAETIQAEAGIILPAEGYLFQLQKRCNETGTLLIIDDVQMGMGRTGKFSSFEHYQVVPDILVLAKGLGAGMPLGAFISNKKLMDCLSFEPELGHITTFGGHPVSCAAALAGLTVLLSGNLLSKVEEKGLRFYNFLEGNPSVAQIRRAGLAIGVDLVNPEKRNQLSTEALSNGIILDWYLFKPATFRIAPPLTITESEIDEACQRLLKALEMIL